MCSRSQILNDPVKVCDGGLLLIIKLLCWTLSIVFVKFVYDILEADPASKTLYNFKLN
jgi:hypothetical protein